VILTEEENLISAHRRHVDSVVDIVKHDMALLEVVDKPNSDIESYMMQLD
jgi:kinesin family protein 2/24